MMMLTMESKYLKIYEKKADQKKNMGKERNLTMSN